jgi:hypothetical protein
MAEVASPLRPYASRFAIEPTKIQILIGTNRPAGFLEIGDTCDLSALYLRLIAEDHEVRIFIAEKECHGIGRHRGTDNFRSSARRKGNPLSGSMHRASTNIKPACLKLLAHA